MNNKPIQYGFIPKVEKKVEPKKESTIKKNTNTTKNK